MGMYTYLYGDDLAPPTHEVLSRDKTLFSQKKGHLPIAWLALFEPQDVWRSPGIEGWPEDDGSQARTSRPRAEALNLLRSRRGWLLRVFPFCEPAWLDALDEIVDTAPCTWLHLRAADFVDEVDVLRRMLTMFDESPEPMPEFDDPASYDYGPPDPSEPARVRNGIRVLPYVDADHQERLAKQGLLGWDEYATLFLSSYSGGGHMPVEAFIGDWDDRTAPLLVAGIARSD